MSEIHRASFPAGHYFAAIAGLAALRRLLARPAEAEPRIDDLRRIVGGSNEFPNDIRVDVVEYTLEAGYEAWAATYDGPNPAIEAEEPVVRAMIAELEPGAALDAACGTGRHTRFLADQGWDTIGIDASPAMLDVARRNHPSIDFRSGRLEALPVDDASVDLVVSALAVCHAPDLQPIFDELARVLRAGGVAIISDPHPMTVQLGGVAAFRDREADPTEGLTLSFVRNLHHPLHTYVNAAVAAGFTVNECREPTYVAEAIQTNPAYAVHPEAVEQAFDGLPFIVVWRFQRSG